MTRVMMDVGSGQKVAELFRRSADDIQTILLTLNNEVAAFVGGEWTDAESSRFRKDFEDWSKEMIGSINQLEEFSSHLQRLMAMMEQYLEP